jgi:hypothetical protein
MALREINALRARPDAQADQATAERKAILELGDYMFRGYIGREAREVLDRYMEAIRARGVR